MVDLTAAMVARDTILANSNAVLMAVEFPPAGSPVPSVDHAVSLHFPTWDYMVRMGKHDPSLETFQKGGYPRTFIHKDIKDLAEICQLKCDIRDPCLLFPAYEHALLCQDFIRVKTASSSYLSEDGIQIQQLAFFTSDGTDVPGVDIYAIFIPIDLFQHGRCFWRLTGLGISSRFARKCLSLGFWSYPAAQVPTSNELDGGGRNGMTMNASQTLRERLSALYERAVQREHGAVRVSKDDVYLYPSGMAAIYYATRLLDQTVPGNRVVVFGFPYELTLALQETYSSSCQFFAFGTDHELDEFEAMLKAGGSPEKVKAVWCECASNPLLKTVDLKRIRQLADMYDFAVVVDDSIGAVANVDVLGVADVVATSLTKTFSGFANVLAGSIVLNPRSRYFNSFKEYMLRTFEDFLHVDDAKQLEINSRDYLERTRKTNKTAYRLVKTIQKLVNVESGPLTAIHYPALGWSTHNYRCQMREADDTFEPGFGAVFTLDFRDVETSAAFFDALDLHKGPSFGAPVTLALPYIQITFQDSIEWVKARGVNETIVRIAVGLEDADELERTLLYAIEQSKSTGDHSDSLHSAQSS